MDDPDLVRRLEGVRDLRRDVERVGERERAARAADGAARPFA